MRRWLAGCVLFLLAACASKPPVVVERSLTGAGAAEHMVLPGDTLYSIAVRYDKDYRELARLNALDDAFLIRPGQRLRLVGKPAPAKPPAAKSASRPAPSPAKPAPSTTQPPNNVTPVAKKQPSVGGVPAVVTAPSSASASLVWGWPVKGSLLSRFGSPGLPGKGLDIAAKRGDSVLAASDGTVVYAGSGLVGYGKLLILRHDENYISAYAHNDRFLVAEGERVKLGQAIAVVGASGTDREKLHFEIREGGKPVDPLRFLPARE